MKRLAKWFGLLGVLCFLLLAPMQAEAASVSILEHPTVAVVNFENHAITSSEWKDEDTSSILDYVSDELSNTHKFTMVERSRMKALFDEMHLQMTGMTDASTNAQIGKQLGAQYLVVGSVTGLTTRRSQASVVGAGQKKCRVTAMIALRIVDVETGEIVLAARGVGTDTNKLTRAPFNIIRIGTDEVDKQQVVDALENAAEDAVEGDRGIVAHMEGRKARK